MKNIARAGLACLVALTAGLPSLAQSDSDPGSYQEMVARSAEKFSDNKLGFTCTDVDVSVLMRDERKPELERLLVRLAMDPGVQANYIAVGNYYARRSMWAHAAAAYTCANGLDDKVPTVWNNLAIVYLGQSNPSAAVTALRKALRLDPEYGLAYYNLGTAYDALGKYEAAVDAYERAITLEPKLATVAYNPQVAANEHQLQLFLRRLAKNPIALASALDE